MNTCKGACYGPRLAALAMFGVGSAAQADSLRLEALPTGLGAPQGVVDVPVARVFFGDVPLSGALIGTSHIECRFGIALGSPGSRRILLEYQDPGRALRSCMLSVQRSSLPETRKLLTIPLAPLHPEDASVEVRFTNPDCPSRPYLAYFEPSAALAEGQSYAPPTLKTDARGIPLQNGLWRGFTKADTYCLGEDMARSRERPGSPATRLLSWIGEAGQGARVFFSTHVFTDMGLRDALCAAARRGARLELAVGESSPEASSLVADCGARALGTVASAGNVGNEIPGAHFLAIENSGSDSVRLVFQGADATQEGLSVQQGSWTFVEKPRASKFVRDHLCYRDALGATDFGVGGVGAFVRELSACREATAAEDSSDLEVFLVPGEREGRSEGDVLVSALGREMESATGVDMTIRPDRAGRPVASELFDLLQKRLSSDRNFRLRVILDQESHWVANALKPDATGVFPYDSFPANARLRAGSSGRESEFGRENFDAVAKLVELGAEVHFLESNLMGSRLPLESSLIFRRDGGNLSVFHGSGGFSADGLHRDGGTYYLVRDGRLTSAWGFEYLYLWDTLSTPVSELPLTWAAQVQGDPNWESWRAAIATRKEVPAPTPSP